ncbi:hypothetical protein HPB50_012373 [Hyalomma asiaticum]|uniref:Uncharacterized protein n=1 Tax=Hyalomma asiaticum TaxID=266040 RepID=A0ACB7TIV0_HYAAI|nr:hypothetical protein HPB50_012373 [Hyalomma asiaticum]
MKTILRVLQLQEDHPARKLATYFLGVWGRLFLPALPSGPKAFSPTPFYRHVVGIYKRIASLQLDTPLFEIRNTELAQELLVNSGCEAPSSSFPWVLLTPSWLPGTVQDTIWHFGWAVLPTADRMYKWHYLPTEQCVNFRKHESNEHALLKCRFAVTFWSLVGRAFRSLGVERFIKGGRCPNSALARLVLAAGLFSLWENRCLAVRQAKPRRSQWPTLTRLYNIVLDHLEAELFSQGEEEFLKRWSCEFIRVVNNRVCLVCTPIQCLRAV